MVLLFRSFCLVRDSTHFQDFGVHSFIFVPSWIKVKEFKPILAPQEWITRFLTKGVATGYFSPQKSENRMFDLGYGYQVFWDVRR